MPVSKLDIKKIKRKKKISWIRKIVWTHNTENFFINDDENTMK